MLISELKNQIETGKYIEELIHVKKYLSIIEKQIIANKIIDSCIEENENQLIKINYFMKKIITDMVLITNYTELVFEDEWIVDFDYLSENGYIDWIIGEIPDSEIEFILDLVEDELDQVVRIGNSLENILADKLEKIISKIPDSKEIKKLMNDVPKQINKIKPENMSILRDMISKQGGQVGN